MFATEVGAGGGGEDGSCWRGGMFCGCEQQSTLGAERFDTVGGGSYSPFASENAKHIHWTQFIIFCLKPSSFENEPSDNIVFLLRRHTGDLVG